MQSKSQSVEDYIESLPEDRQSVVSKIVEVMEQNLPSGFEKTMGYGMIAF